VDPLSGVAEIQTAEEVLAAEGVLTEMVVQVEEGRRQQCCQGVVVEEGVEAVEEVQP